MNRVAHCLGKWLATFLSKEIQIKGTAPPSNPLHLQASLRPGDVLLVEGIVMQNLLLHQGILSFYK